MIFYYLGVVLVALAVVTVSCPPLLSRAFSCKRLLSNIDDSSINLLKTLVDGSLEEVKTAVQGRKFSVSVTQMQHLDLPRKVRRGRNKLLVFCLGESQATAFVILKERMSISTAQKIIQDFKHSNSRWEKLIDSVEDLKNCLKQKYHDAKCVVTYKDLSCGCFNTQKACFQCIETPTTDGLGASLLRFGKVVLSYIDVTKDSALVIKLITLIGWQIFTEPTIFQSVIIWLLISSIAVPFLKSAVETTLLYPHTVLEASTSRPKGRKLKALQAVVFCGYLFVPSLLIRNRERAKLARKILLEKSKDDYLSTGTVRKEIQDELQELEKYEEDVKEAYLIFKRNEASFEIVLQMGLQLIMLLLSMSTIPTHAGLQGVFGRDYSQHENVFRAQFGTGLEIVDLSEWLLVGSIIWSFKTVCTTFIWIKSAKKSHSVGVAAKGALGLRAFFFSTSRIFALVAFFGPFLGLMDCLAHWKAQQKTLDPELLEKVSNTSNAYWDRDTFQSLYKTLGSSEFTEYTVLSLREAFFLLIGSSFLMGLLIFLVKRKMSSDFKEASYVSQLQHMAEAFNFPDAYSDWDDDSGNAQVDEQKTHNDDHDFQASICHRQNTRIGGGRWQRRQSSWS